MKGLLKKAIGLAIAGSMIFGILPTSGFAENKDATITKNSLHGYYLDNTTSLTEPSTNLIAKSASNRYAIYEFDLPNVTADAVKSIKVNVTPVYLGSINTDYIHLYAINIPDNATRDAATVKTLVDNARADAYEFYNAKNNTTYNVSNANNAKIGIEAGIDPDNKTTLYVPKVDWAPTNPDSSGKGNIVGKTGEFDITEYIKGYAYDETTNARKYSKIAVVMNSYNDVRFAPSATINTVIDKNVYLDKLKAAKTGKALNSIISGLTSEECEILGIDTTAYKALTFPRYAAEQIIIDGFNTLTDFVSCLQSDVSKVSNASQSDYNIQFTNNIDDDATEISTDLSSITVDFGTDLAPGCWNNTNVTLEKASDGTVVSISLNNDFVVTINEQLRKATEYILTIKNLKDDSNNDLVNRRIYFKTAFYFDKLEFDTKDALRIGEEIDLNVYGIYDENRVDANADITVSDTNVVSYSNGKLTGLAYGYAVITATVENGRGGDVVAKKIVVVSPAQKKYDFEENGNSADSHTGNGAYATIGNEETIFESNYETFAVSVWFKDNMSIIAANSFGIKNATISIQNNDYVAGAGSMSRSAGWHNAVFVCDETKTTVFINGIKIDEIQSVDAEFIADAEQNAIILDDINVFRLNNSNPTIENLTISGNKGSFAEFDTTLSAAWEYSDVDGDLENGTEYGWYVCDTENGTYTLYESAESITIESDVIGKYLKFVVIPKNDVSTGTAYESSIFSVSYGKITEKLLDMINNAGFDEMSEIITTYADIIGIDASKLEMLEDSSYVFSGMVNITYTTLEDVVNKYNACLSEYLVEKHLPVDNIYAYSLDDDNFKDVSDMVSFGLYRNRQYFVLDNLSNLDSLCKIALRVYSASSLEAKMSSYYVFNPALYTEEEEWLREIEDYAKGIDVACEGKNERIYNFPDTINVDLRENYSLVAEFMNTGDCKLYLNGDATASRRPYFVTLYDKTLIQSKEAIFSIKNGTNDVKTNNFSYQIEFKKPIDVATINTDNIYIEQDDGTKVAINIKLDAQNSNTDSTIYNVTATQPLLNGTYYSLIMKDVKDSSGNELSDQKTVFKTEYILNDIFVNVKTSMSVGQSQNITIKGLNGTDFVDISNVNYTLSDSDVVKIENGKLIALKRGVSKITATYHNADGNNISKSIFVNVYNKNSANNFESDEYSNDYAYNGFFSKEVNGQETILTSQYTNYAEIWYYTDGQTNDAQISFGGTAIGCNATIGWHQVVFDNRTDTMQVYVDGIQSAAEEFTGTGNIGVSGSGIYVDYANINDILGTVCVANYPAIRGSQTVGSTLTASYGYYDADGDAENGTVIKWYKANAVNGTYEQFATGATFVVSTVLPFVKVGITPANIYEQGAEVFSPVISVTIPQTGDGKNGGASGGFGGITAEISAPLPVAAVQNTGFTDVSKEHWAYNAIQKVKEKGIITGYGDNTFNPEGLVTRAEFAVMAVKLLDIPLTTYKGAFEDVSERDWYAEAVATAYENDLISGYNGVFEPNSYISREQIARIITEVYEKIHGSIEINTSKEDFADINEAGEWSRDYIKKAESAGLISGVGENRFEAKRNATRAEAAAIINNILESM